MVYGRVVYARGLLARIAGVEPMGVVWSLQQADGQRPGLRLVKQDVATPLVTHIYVIDGHVTVRSQSEIGESPLATGQMRRFYQWEGVRVEPVNWGAVRGALFLPPGKL